MPQEVRQSLFANGLFICIAGVATLIHDWASNPSNAQGTFLALDSIGLALMAGALRRPGAGLRRFIVQVVVQAAILIMWAALIFDESNRRYPYIAIWLACGFLSLRALISLSRQWDHPDRRALLQNARRAARSDWRGGETRRVNARGDSRAIRIRPAPFLTLFAFIILANYRHASIGATLGTSFLLIAFAGALYASHRLREHQSILVGEGALVVHRWDLRPLPFRPDRIRALLLLRVQSGAVGPSVLLVTDVDDVCLARVWGVEWDAALLSAALEPLGVAVTSNDLVPKRPQEIEAVYVGSMRPWELHPVLGGLLILAVGLFSAAAVRSCFGALTGM